MDISIERKIEMINVIKAKEGYLLMKIRQLLQIKVGH
nr:MAG TPA: hypothetical protein [Caudoviricetes sp.]